MFKGAESTLMFLLKKPQGITPKIQTLTVNENICQQRESNMRRHLEQKVVSALPYRTFCPFFILWTIEPWAYEEVRKNVLFFRGNSFL